MNGYTYLALLLVSILGLFVLDHRFKLAYFIDHRRTLLTIALSVALFLVWDVLGILLGIFFIGDSPLLSGIRLAPELPVEEIFFLILLSYNALLLWQGSKRLWSRT